MDGMEAVRVIRGGIDGEYAQAVPIIMMTANVVAGRREMFLRNGADDVLAKPVDRALLDAILKTWMPESKQVRKPPDGRPEEAEKIAIEIPGLNVRAWFANLGGGLAFYLDVLASFCRHAEEKTPEIRAAAAAGNIKLYTVLVHGLKGAARGINADAFAALAAQMEKAGENTDLSAINGQTESFLAELRALTGHIRAALERHEERGRIAEQADLRIGELKNALLDMNIAVVNDLLAQYVEMSLEDSIRNIISEIDQHVLLCEYDEAIRKIELLQSRERPGDAP
jgi:HPt (histidine-containing phosphotransfer) domain-containing protein